MIREVRGKSGTATLINYCLKSTTAKQRVSRSLAQARFAAVRARNAQISVEQDCLAEYQPGLIPDLPGARILFGSSAFFIVRFSLRMAGP
jgi:hypothetical protein